MKSGIDPIEKPGNGLDWQTLPLNAFRDLTLERIEAAAAFVEREIGTTPQEKISGLHPDCDIWVKHEEQIETGAFKVRGGLTYFDWLTKTQVCSKGVIAATRGNHGQSVAFAARANDLQATVVVPVGNSVSKNEAMIELGAELIEEGDDFADAMRLAQDLSERRGLHFVPSFDWKLVLGVASYALEFFREAGELDTVYVPIGLGSGICGMVAVRNALGLKTEIVGVVAENAPAYLNSFVEEQVVIEPEIPDTIADGVACRMPDSRSLNVILNNVSRIVAVPEKGIAEGIRRFHEVTGISAEGAGAIALGALLGEGLSLKGQKVGLILSGGNIDAELLDQVLADD